MTTNIITPEEFAEQMIQLAEKYSDDTETCHIMMDALMCDILESLGYNKGVAIFNETDMWYA